MSTGVSTPDTGPQSPTDNALKVLSRYPKEALPLEPRLQCLVNRLCEAIQDKNQIGRPLPPDLQSLLDAIEELHRSSKDGQYLKVESEFVMGEDDELVERTKVVVRDLAATQGGAPDPADYDPTKLPPLPPKPAPVHSPRTLKRRNSVWLPAAARDNDCKDVRWIHKPPTPGKRPPPETKSSTSKRRKTGDAGKDKEKEAGSSSITRKGKGKGRATRNSGSEAASANPPKTSAGPSSSKNATGNKVSPEEAGGASVLALPVTPTRPKRVTRQTKAALAVQTQGNTSKALDTVAAAAPTSRNGTKKTKKASGTKKSTSAASDKSQSSGHAAPKASQQSTANVTKPVHATPSKTAARKPTSKTVAAETSSPLSTRRATRSSKPSTVSYPLPVVAFASPRSSGSGSSAASTALVRAQPSRKTTSATSLPSDGRLATPALTNGSTSRESSLSLSGESSAGSVVARPIAVIPGGVGVLDLLDAKKKVDGVPKSTTATGPRVPSPVPEQEEEDEEGGIDDLFGDDGDDDDEDSDEDSDSDGNGDALEAQLLAEMEEMIGESDDSDEEDD